MSKTVEIEGYVIRFKKKKGVPTLLSPSSGILINFVIEKKLKNDYLYFNPNRPGTEVFGSRPDIINSEKVTVDELKNTWSIYKKYNVDRNPVDDFQLKELKTYFDMDHPEIVKIQIMRTEEVMEEI